MNDVDPRELDDVNSRYMTKMRLSKGSRILLIFEFLMAGFILLRSEVWPNFETRT